MPDLIVILPRILSDFRLNVNPQILSNQYHLSVTLWGLQNYSPPKVSYSVTTAIIMTNYQQLLKSIDEIKATGKKVTVTVLPSQINRKRKALLWATLTIWPDDVTKLITIHTLTHTNTCPAIWWSLCFVRVRMAHKSLESLRLSLRTVITSNRCKFPRPSQLSNRWSSDNIRALYEGLI